MRAQKQVQPEALRCAIYTRKSTSEGLDSDFNTLDAQREAGEMYVRSQACHGWTVVPTRYDDGGFTGANMERPALKRLLDDIDQGLVDCVVVYKVDRLSRSLIDFARMMEVFDQKGVSCVSTTQQFNTATPIGRFTLHILLSFAQFEREMISERTRDKMAAARRRGKWIGGPPVLGYQADDVFHKLEVVPAEAEQVKTIFALYLETRSMGAVLKHLDKLKWTKKAYVTRTGKAMGGGPFNENVIQRILRNPIYTGKVVYNGELYAGEHEALIDVETFNRVQASLDAKRCGRGKRRQRNFDYILQGVLHCRCGSSMTTASATGRNKVPYRYYRCGSQRRGLEACSHPRVPATDVEAAVVTRIREIGSDPALRAEVAERLKTAGAEQAAALHSEKTAQEQRAAALNKEARELLAFVRDNDGVGSQVVPERLAEIEAGLAEARARLNDIVARKAENAVTARRVDAGLAILENFTEVWDVLVAEEQCELVTLLVRRVDVDLVEGRLRINMHQLVNHEEAIAGTQAEPSGAPTETPVP